MDGFLTEKQVLDRIVPWSRTTLWRKVRAGQFPAPRALSENRRGWLRSQVSEWVESRPVADAYQASEGLGE
jgi:prophage regulatory protein